jgi:hypothetical protein
MVARLGQIIYWMACGLVPFWIVGSAIHLRWHDWFHDGSIVIAGGFSIWVFGRAALYVLSGK